LAIRQSRYDEDAMTRNFRAVSKAAHTMAAGAVVAIALAGAAGAQSSPQYDSRGRPTYGANGPNVVYQQGPHTRIYVTKRSWLDGGTEVLPGDRKFTDYAFPPTTSFATENNNRSLERQPLSTPTDLGGAPTRFPLY
jgi:hypothetical protein